MAQSLGVFEAFWRLIALLQAELLGFALTASYFFLSCQEEVAKKK